MPPPAEIAAILKPLGDAYPERKPDIATLKIYIENLEDIPARLLKAAVSEHIRLSPWFPKISELREAAAKIAGTHRFETVAPAPRPSPDTIGYEVWPLNVRFQALQDAFFHEGRFEIDEFEALAAEFDAADHPHSADAVRRKLAGMIRICEAQGVDGS